jgi:hypothetical protein
MSSVFLLFFVFVCFLFCFLSCSQSTFSPPLYLIFCYLPSYQNLVNLFFIYILNHFFFYSNQIIPFLFYFYFSFLRSLFIFFYITNLFQFLYFCYVTLYFLFSFLLTINCAILIYHKQNNLK